MRLSRSDMQWLSGFEGYHYAVDNCGRYADTLRLMRDYVSGGTCVIDLGMYPGHLALLAGKHYGAKVMGLSFSHSSTFEGRMRKEGIEVIETDITKENLPFDEGSFDVAICTEIIEHLDRPLDLLMKANRILKTNGVLILSTPNHASLKNRVNLFFGKPTNQHLFGVDHVYQMNEWVHKREYTIGELGRLLEPVGFRIEKVQYTELEHPPDSFRTRVTQLLKKVLYLRQSLKGGIILAARKTRAAEYTSVVPGVLRSSVRAVPESVIAKPSEEIDLKVVAQNAGDTVWLRENGEGYGFVQLGGHLSDGNNALVHFDYLRHPLSRDVAPRETEEIALRFKAPSSGGKYTLELDMVNEGISWFKDYGSVTARVKLDVRK